MTGSGDLWWFAPGLRAFRQNEVGGGKISRGTWLEETWPRHCPSFREGFGRGLMARGEPPPAHGELQRDSDYELSPGRAASGPQAWP